MIEGVARLRVEVNHTAPKIWRWVEVPLSFTLLDLNDVMQAAFDWDGDHLWGFHLGKGDLKRVGTVTRFGWGPETAQEVQLKTLVDWGVKKFQYIYDYGDGWEHLITIMRVLDAVQGLKYPNLVAGANRAPIEDIGGISGFYRFVEAAKDPNHPDRERFEDWFGESAMKEFDHESFDNELVERRFARFY